MYSKCYFTLDLASDIHLMFLFIFNIFIIYLMFYVTFILSSLLMGLIMSIIIFISDI